MDKLERSLARVIDANNLSQEFYYGGLTKDGKIIYHYRNGQEVGIDLNVDFTKVLREGIKNGVFTENNSVENNPNGIVARHEFFHELARYSGEVYTTEGEVQSGVEDLYQANKELVDSICGQESYYKYSFAWLLNSDMALEELYSFRDMQGAMTWFEIAYILYFVAQWKPTFRWSGMSIPDHLRVSYIKTEIHGVPRLEMRLQEYRGSMAWMKTYINALVTGKKSLPIHVVWAMEELRRVLGGHLDSSYTWATVEVTREDFINQLQPILIKHYKG